MCIDTLRSECVDVMLCNYRLQRFNHKPQLIILSPLTDNLLHHRHLACSADIHVTINAESPCRQKITNINYIITG